MKRFIFGFLVLVAGFLRAQQNENVDFLELKADITFDLDSSAVNGDVVLKFKVLKDVDSIYIDAKGMNFQIETCQHCFPNKFHFDGNKLWLIGKFKANKEIQFNFNYSTKPKKALYFTKRKGDWNIWTQGQGKYTSNWLPSFDDMNEKVEFDLSITFNEDYTVLANGKLDSISNSEGFKTWHYNMQKPMPSYLVALAIGKYNKKTETSKRGIPLEYYFYPEDSLKVEPTYRYTKQMFDFLENEIGFAYPWQNYKQVPVHDFLYSGMENTSLTIFSDAFVVDSTGFNDKNYVNVNAHELTHQWFGDLVTATSGEHHWLQEGFATYYALLAEKEVFGQDYFDFKLFNSALDLERQNQAGESTSLLNPKSSSLTFYQRGAWVLYALRLHVGDVIFKKAVKSYLEKHQFKNVETEDFISEVERFYDRSLNQFVNTWIKAEKFPYNAAIVNIHQESKYIQEYIKMQCNDPEFDCEAALNSDISEDAKVKIISQRPDLISKSTFNNGLKVRQAISKYMRRIPKELKSDYESLLDAESYLTIENALYNLWKSFPEDRIKYLSKTRTIQGFNDKNVRLLWLLLHLNTSEYNAYGKDNIFLELKNYTKPYYNAELRMNAFRYLKMIDACDDSCKADLEQAKTHHNWRMVKFAKDMLEELKKPTD